MKSAHKMTSWLWSSEYAMMRQLQLYISPQWISLSLNSVPIQSQEYYTQQLQYVLMRC